MLDTILLYALFAILVWLTVLVILAIRGEA